MILHAVFRDCGVESRVQEDWYAIAVYWWGGTEYEGEDGDDDTMVVTVTIALGKALWQLDYLRCCLQRLSVNIR